MTRREELLSLAARVEATQGADRELDRRINHIRWPVPQPAFHLKLSLRDHWDVPAFTASLDAAASLVPVGWGWRAIYHPSAGRAWFAVGGSGKPYGTANSVLPALALTAAALRAMAEEAGE